eukprot:7383796-Prymnesium_polylepis.1
MSRLPSLSASVAALPAFFSAALRAFAFLALTCDRSFSMGPGGGGFVLSSSRILASALSAQLRASVLSSSTPRTSPRRKPIASIRSSSAPYSACTVSSEQASKYSLTTCLQSLQSKREVISAAFDLPIATATPLPPVMSRTSRRRSSESFSFHTEAAERSLAALSFE